MRRLSAPEFAASIRSIFQDPSAPVATVFADPTVLGFSIDANTLLVQGLNASQLMDNAEAVASWAAEQGKLAQFASCSTVDEACAQQFISAFGARAFRSPFPAGDGRFAPYQALFLGEDSFSNAAQAVISAMLQSPYFLYRSELGTPNGAGFDLTPPEVASSLSYLLTGDMPDDTLMAAAAQVQAGGLSMADMVNQQADRLLADGSPYHATALMEFMTGWLGLGRLYTAAKDDTIFKLTDTMRDAMGTETRSLLLEAFDGGGSFSSVLTADHTFLNDALAGYYGLDSTGLTADFVSVPLATATATGGHRDAGLLAQASILNGYARPDASSPTQRGHMVRSRLLCQAVPPPPPNVNTTLKPATNAQTTRQQIETAHSLGTCAGCHQLMDPLGFGFEHYDQYGRYRDTENGVAIDDSGKIVNANPRDGSPTFTGLSGPGSLSEYLAADPDVTQCLIRYWSYTSFGSASWPQDACTYDAIYNEAQGQGFSLRSVLVGIIHSPNFLHRVQDQ